MELVFLALIDEEIVPRKFLSLGKSDSPHADFVEQDFGGFSLNSGELAHENVFCMPCSTKMSDINCTVSTKGGWK